MDLSSVLKTSRTDCSKIELWKDPALDRPYLRMLDKFVFSCHCITWKQGFWNSLFPKFCLSKVVCLKNCSVLGSVKSHRCSFFALVLELGRVGVEFTLLTRLPWYLGTLNIFLYKKETALSVYWTHLAPSNHLDKKGDLTVRPPEH